MRDPVWGGAYQYSADGHWTEPHFEKLINIQAQTIRSNSLAYAQWHDADYLRVTQSVDGYVRKFLTSPDGAFYVSQDADLVEVELRESISNWTMRRGDARGFHAWIRMSIRGRTGG